MLTAVATFETLGLNAEAQHQNTWETCSLTEGKGGDICGPGDPPRVFSGYLVAGAWTENIRGDLFTEEFQWDLKNLASGHPKVTWREVGAFGTHRIRNVRYQDGDVVFADVLLVERNQGIFSPLMKWAGKMPDAEVYETPGHQTTKILVVAKDFGGNIPMVRTWAWVWTERGPVQLDFQSAVQEAIQRVAPGRSAYDTGLDWHKLEFRTYTWPAGNYPGKIGVSEELDAWFALKGVKLAVTRVEFRNSDGETIRWP